MKIFGKNVKTYDANVKIKAIKAMHRKDRRPSELSKKLNIPVGTLYTWLEKDKKRNANLERKTTNKILDKKPNKISLLIEAEIAELKNKIITLKTLKGILNV